MTEISKITEVQFDEDDGGVAVTYESGWTLFVTAEELDGFVPQVGHDIIVGPSIGRPIQYIEINGFVLRNISDEQQAELHAEMVAGFRRKKEEKFAAHGEEWKEKARNLLPPLAARIKRFEDANPDFWIEDGGYELYALEAANVLVLRAWFVYPYSVDKQIEWIDWWDSLNSKAHGYNYKLQMEILPAFGDGHSGNTHGAAVAYAKRVVRGQEC